MNVLHAAIVIVGLIILGMVTTPLGLLIRDALGNPRMLNVSMQQGNNSILITLAYNGTIKLTDVNFTAVIKSGGHVISKSAYTGELDKNSTILIKIPQSELNATSGLRFEELVLKGKVSGLYPFEITYHPTGG
ncbi:MAG: hypothetical protein F7B59_06805 [Desulfurococcales archaeon]|nr:hypothetical protein [Desulfurococcales archaeon]